jgi:equilibrative nucleoside transporter 1/2/3
VIAPILSATLPAAGGFAVMCILIVVMGAANAIGQTSVFGLGGMLPEKYTNAIMVGNGLAGIMLNVARIITLAAFPPTSAGLLESVVLYFIIAGLSLVVCCFAQLYLMRNSFVKACLHKASNPDVGVEDLTTTELLEADQEVKDDADKPHDVKELFGGVWQFAFLVWLCYVVTFGMFPGVSTATDVSGLPYEWFSVLIITTFNVFDVLGRNLPAWIFPSPKVIWIMVISRFIFWVTFILIASDDPSIDPDWLFGGSWFIFLNMAVFAVSNGFASTMCMIYGPSKVPDFWKDRAGYICATGLVFGIFCGTVIAIAFEGVGKIPS